MSDQTSGIVVRTTGQTLSSNKEKRREQIKARVEAAGFAFVTFRQFKYQPSYPATYSLSVTVPGDDLESPICATQTIEITGQVALEQLTADPATLYALIQRHRAGNIREGLQLWRKQSDMESTAKAYGDLTGKCELLRLGVADQGRLDEGVPLSEQLASTLSKLEDTGRLLEAQVRVYLATKAECDRILAVVPPPCLLPEVYESSVLPKCLREPGVASAILGPIGNLTKAG